MSPPGVSGRRFWALGLGALAAVAVLGALATSATGDGMWAIGAAGIGVLVMFVLIAIAKRREQP